jgi:hypothetical protein
LKSRHWRIQPRFSGRKTARFAIFLTFRDGKIVRQHNYDCFDPW